MVDGVGLGAVVVAVEVGDVVVFLGCRQKRRAAWPTEPHLVLRCAS